jgi:uncharacterized protein
MRNSVVAGVYDTVVDRESAYERLKGRATQSAAPEAPTPQGAAPKSNPWLGELLGTSGNRRGDSLVEAMAKSAARTMGSTVGRQIIRGVLGSLLGGTSRR